MSWKVTLTVTVTNPDSGRQYQAKDSVLSFDPEATPQAIIDKALTFLTTEIDHPRLPLDEDPDATAADATDDVEEWDDADADAEAVPAPA
jgi:hypothetical protein